MNLRKLNREKPINNIIKFKTSNDNTIYYFDNKNSISRAHQPNKYKVYWFDKKTDKKIFSIISYTLEEINMFLNKGIWTKI